MKEQNTAIPSSSGVYLFKNHAGEILYIGKAKSIRKRVHSYFQNYAKDWKIKALIDEHSSIDHVATKTETEALILEAKLIKEHQPKFNVLLKSGQPFLYLLFTVGKPAKLELVRNKKRKGSYFGPFLHKRQARSVYQYLLKTFRLEWCTKKIEEGCLRYHIGLCVGNCRNDFDEGEYLFRLALTKEMLKGNYKKSLQDLKDHIDELTARLEFEKAQHLHEYATNLDTIFNTLRTKFSDKRYEHDVFLATTPLAQRTTPDLPLANKLQAFLKTKHPIRVIDCFDISHFQSSFIVGSCIRFVNGVPDKNNFRRFKIKTLEQQNDYAALREVVARRYKDTGHMPDLIIIDGGKGQLNATKDLARDACITSLAKREERLFADRFPEGVVLEQSKDTGKLFIAIRDYAHHFALNYHRKRRGQKF